MLALRIIAGQMKGKLIKAPPGLDTRPVTDRIRENLFNIWQADIAGAKFLDLFAGSGSMGIEAMSRGASEVVMVEKSAQAVKVIEANLRACGLFSKIKILHLDIRRALERLEKSGKTFDIIFIDPPFKAPDLAQQVLEQLSGLQLAANGQVVIRVQSGHKLPESFGELIQYRVIKYGESTINYFNFIKSEVSKMNGVYNLLEELENILRNAKTVPFASGKAIVEGDRMMEIIDRLRAIMPEELAAAKQIIANKENIVQSAYAEADDYVSASKDRAAKLVDDNEITAKAIQKAEAIVENAEKSAAAIHRDVDAYAEEVLAHIEIVLKRGLDAIQQGKDQLHNSYKEY